MFKVFKFCTRLRLLSWLHFFTWLFTRMLLTRLTWTPVRMSQTLCNTSQKISRVLYQHISSPETFKIFQAC